MGQSLAEKNKHVNQWKWKSQSLGWLFFVNMWLFDVGIEWTTVRIRQEPHLKYSEMTNSWLDMLLFSNRSVLYLYMLLCSLGKTSTIHYSY